jgi:hypothetical protein
MTASVIASGILIFSPTLTGIRTTKLPTTYRHRKRAGSPLPVLRLWPRRLPYVYGTARFAALAAVAEGSGLAEPARNSPHYHLELLPRLYAWR